MWQCCAHLQTQKKLGFPHCDLTGIMVYIYIHMFIYRESSPHGPTLQDCETWVFSNVYIYIQILHTHLIYIYKYTAHIPHSGVAIMFIMFQFSRSIFLVPPQVLPGFSPGHNGLGVLWERYWSRPRLVTGGLDPFGFPQLNGSQCHWVARLMPQKHTVHGKIHGNE